MPHSLHVLRRMAACFLLASVGFNAMAFAAPVNNRASIGYISAQSVQSHELSAPVGLDISSGEASVNSGKPVLLAHHEASVGVSQLLTANATSVVSTVSKSLWGNMVLSMALQQDDQVQQINKKLGRVSSWVFASVGMISALSIAQGIDGLATLQQDPHPYHPPILGLVGSSLTLVSVASQAIMIHRCKKQLVKRQEEVADQVAHVLEHLKNDGLTDHVHSELSGLIGLQGAEEFLGLWQAAHPH